MIVTERKLDKPRGMASAVLAGSRTAGSVNTEAPLGSASDNKIPSVIANQGNMNHTMEAPSVAAISSKASAGFLNGKPKSSKNNTVSAGASSPMCPAAMVLFRSDDKTNSNTTSHKNGGETHMSLANDDSSVVIDEEDYCVMLSAGPQPLPDIPLSLGLLSTAKRTADETVWRFDGLDPSDAVSRSKKRKDVPSRITIHHSSLKSGASRVKKARVGPGRPGDAHSRLLVDLPGNTKLKGTQIRSADRQGSKSTACDANGRYPKKK